MDKFKNGDEIRDIKTGMSFYAFIVDEKGVFWMEKDTKSQSPACFTTGNNLAEVPELYEIIKGPRPQAPQQLRPPTLEEMANNETSFTVPEFRDSYRAQIYMDHFEHYKDVDTAIQKTMVVMLALFGEKQNQIQNFNINKKS